MFLALPMVYAKSGSESSTVRKMRGTAGRETACACSHRFSPHPMGVPAAYTCVFSPYFNRS